MTLLPLSPLRVQVIGPDSEVKLFSLDALKQLPAETVAVTLQCAGNRRSEMSRERKVNGLSWDVAVSTANWTGVRLSTILKEMGVTPGEDAKHVQFIGLDCDTEGALLQRLAWHPDAWAAASAAAS